MNYYNEIDRQAAAWLRELIAAGLIPEGDVDERSICDVKGTDIHGYTQCHFFAGIGGWSLALRLAGWSDDRPVWTGSCPCQPFSVAGKGRGTADERHLWPQFCRLIGECRPPTVFGEQVSSSLGRRWLRGVFAGLESLGYAVAGADLCGPCVGASHIRQRLYWVGNTKQSGIGDNSRKVERKEPEKKGIESKSGGIASTTIDTSILRGVGNAPMRGSGVGGDAAQSGGCGYVERTGGTGLGGVAQSEQSRAGNHSSSVENKGRKSLDSGSTCLRQTDREACTSGIGAGIASLMLVADRQQHGPQGCERSGNLELHGKARPSGSTAAGGASHWSESVAILCRDGKTRRVPAESVFLGMADGFPGIMAESDPERGFPLTAEPIKNRTTMLRGIGNAIMPQVGALFVRSVMGAL